MYIHNMIDQDINTELIAMLLTDGSVSFSGENGREIIFRNKDEKLLENFENILRKLNIKPQKRRFFRRAFQSKVGNKSLAEFLLNQCNTFRTLACNSVPICAKLRGNPERQPCNVCMPLIHNEEQFPTIHVPKFIKNNIELSRKFLRVVTSTEGCVNFSKKMWITRKIRIGCKHPQFRKDIQELISKFGIKSRVHGIEIIIGCKEDIEKFRK